jgi:hypothetical protein
VPKATRNLLAGCGPFPFVAHLGHQVAMMQREPVSVEAEWPRSVFHPQFDSICWNIASTDCGEIPSSTNPGISGDDTVSICISST